MFVGFWYGGSELLPQGRCGWPWGSSFICTPRGRQRQVARLQCCALGTTFFASSGLHIPAAGELPPGHASYASAAGHGSAAAAASFGGWSARCLLGLSAACCAVRACWPFCCTVTLSRYDTSFQSPLGVLHPGIGWASLDENSAGPLPGRTLHSPSRPRQRSTKADD